MNKDTDRIISSHGRRAFLGRSAAALAAGLGASVFPSTMSAQDAIAEAASKVGRLPRRKLSSGREIAVVMGAFNWPVDVIEAGVRCGMNYWHRVNGFKALPDVLLKNREAHYLEVAIDRVKGNHETGVIEEEEHYQAVKQALVDTGARYFDDMKFRFGYHTAAEVKQNRGIVRAFERLKKEGVVKHLSMSQHAYNGNDKVPGGQSAPEILAAVIADGAFEHLQLMYTYGDDKAIADTIAAAKKKGLGVIAMKTMRGIGRMSEDAAFQKTLPAGTTPHNAVVRWLATKTQVDAFGINTANLNQFVENYSGIAAALRGADFRVLEQQRAYADEHVCRLCNECMPHCKERINIADVFRAERYARDYRDLRGGRHLYSTLAVKADACTDCGQCMPNCPQGMAIPRKLAEAHRLLA
jgi:predicted aldo/keto reductase-like oxidoreductase